MYRSLLVKTSLLLLFLTIACSSCKKKEVQPEHECPTPVVPTIQYGTLSVKMTTYCNPDTKKSLGEIYLYKTINDRESGGQPVSRIVVNDTLVTNKIPSQSTIYYYKTFSTDCNSKYVSKVGTVLVKTDSTTILHVKV